jgi:hypothetical protein
MEALSSEEAWMRSFQNGGSMGLDGLRPAFAAKRACFTAFHLPFPVGPLPAACASLMAVAATVSTAESVVWSACWCACIPGGFRPIR